MPIVLNGTTGITNDSGYTGDGVSFADSTPANTLVTTAGGNVGIGTSSPAAKFHVSGQSRVADSSNAANYMTFGVGANASYGNASISTTTAGLSIVAEGAGNMTFLNNGSERARIDSSGNLLVGTTSALGTGKVGILHSTLDNNGLVIRTSSTTYNTGSVLFQNSSGGNAGFIQITGASSVSYATSSDYRLKHDIAPMTGALAKVQQLKPCTYKWNVDDSAGEGFIAHELQAVVPECVTGEKDAVDAEGNPVYQGIDTSFLVATLTAAIQEQQAIINAQQAALESLTARVVALEGA